MGWGFNDFVRDTFKTTAKVFNPIAAYSTDALIGGDEARKDLSAVSKAAKIKGPNALSGPQYTDTTHSDSIYERVADYQKRLAEQRANPISSQPITDMANRLATGSNKYADQLAASNPFADQLAASSSKYADKLAAGNPYASQLASSASSYASKLAAGNPYAAQLAGNTKYADQLAGDMSLVNQLAGNTKYADALMGNTKYADALMGNTKYADQLADQKNHNAGMAMHRLATDRGIRQAMAIAQSQYDPLALRRGLDAQAKIQGEAALQGAIVASQDQRTRNAAIADAGRISNQAMIGAGGIANQAMIGAGNISNAALTNAGRLRNQALIGAGNISNNALLGAGRLHHQGLAEAGRLSNQALLGAGRLHHQGLADAGRLNNQALLGAGQLRNQGLLGAGRLSNQALLGAGQLMTQAQQLQYNQRRADNDDFVKSFNPEIAAYRAKLEANARDRQSNNKTIGGFIGGLGSAIAAL